MSKKAYDELERRFEVIASLSSVEALLHWDMEVMMPAGAGPLRAEAIAAQRSQIHRLHSDPALETLCAAANEEPLDEWQRANLREISRIVRIERAVPATLVAELAHAGTTSVIAWREARKNNKFKQIEPLLSRVVSLARERAQCLATASDLTPYDALLDLYEPGMRSAAIDPIFETLLDVLPGLAQTVITRQEETHSWATPSLFEGHYPASNQKALGLAVMKALGFDFTRGRLDLSTHPFCGGSPNDIRITTRYDERSPIEGLMGTIHETGHALYEQGLPRAWCRQPVGLSRGMAIHESQSLLVEMQACRSREFVTWLAPRLASTFGGDDPNLRRNDLADILLRHYRCVKRTLIRVNADEVTYPLHIILRYRLERALISGDLSVPDLPAAWNDEMNALLQITPASDSEGCLQDIHWMDGTFGYFPTYTLGAIAAAQLYEAALRDEPAIPGEIAAGEFATLRAWLAKHIHSRASFTDTQTLVEDATGTRLDAKIYTNNLVRRYVETP